jgi:peptide/nickel transport system substrate-binding protein
MKTRSAIATACAVAGVGLVLASCGPSTAQPAQGSTPGSVQVVRMAGSDIGFPSPYAYIKGPGLAQTFLIFDSLIWKDSTGKYIPWLATSWSPSSDGLQWTFTLRHNVTWQDGQPFTADDVVFTFDYITKGPAKSALGVIGAVPVTQSVATAPDTVVFTLAKPMATFEDAVAGRVPIAPKHVWATVTDPARYRDPSALVGTGPYKLASYDEAASTYDYVANPTFWGGMPYVKEVQFTPSSNELRSLQVGDLDIANVTKTSDAVLTQLKKNAAYAELSARGESNTALHFNLTRSFPFDNKSFRQAIAYTVDRNDLVKRVLLGEGEAGSMGDLAPSSPWLAPNLPAYNRDLAKARSLLDSIGMTVSASGLRTLPNGQAFTPQLMTTAADAQTAGLIKEYLNAVGINLQVVSVDQATSDASLASARFDMALVDYGAMASDPDWLRQRLSSSVQSKSFLRLPGYNDPAFEAPAVAQLTTMDQTQRKQLVWTMQRVVADDVPLISLYLTNRIAVYKKATFSSWYYTPGGVFGLYPYVLNKHVLVTGKTKGM